VASGKTLVNGAAGAVTVADVGTKVLSGIVVNDGQWGDGGSAGWTFYRTLRSPTAAHSRSVRCTEPTAASATC
jgi:hypothetical protein